MYILDQLEISLSSDNVIVENDAAHFALTVGPSISAPDRSSISFIPSRCLDSLRVEIFVMGDEVRFISFNNIISIRAQGRSIGVFIGEWKEELYNNQSYSINYGTVPGKIVRDQVESIPRRFSEVFGNIPEISNLKVFQETIQFDYKLDDYSPINTVEITPASIFIHPTCFTSSQVLFEDVVDKKDKNIKLKLDSIVNKLYNFIINYFESVRVTANDIADKLNKVYEKYLQDITENITFSI